MIHDVEVGGLTFDASFDSGNAARVEAVSENANEFALWTARDCEGTIHENGCRTWFSFSVRGASLFEGRMLAFRIHNMNSQGALYKHDMRPVFRTLPSQPVWERLPLPATYSGGTADTAAHTDPRPGLLWVPARPREASVGERGSASGVRERHAEGVLEGPGIRQPQRAAVVPDEDCAPRGVARGGDREQ